MRRRQIPTPTTIVKKPLARQITVKIVHRHIKNMNDKFISRTVMIRNRLRRQLRDSVQRMKDLM